MCVIASRMMPGHACVCIHEKKDPYFLNIRKKISDDDDDGAVKMGRTFFKTMCGLWTTTTTTVVVQQSVIYAYIRPCLKNRFLHDYTTHLFDKNQMMLII